MKRTIRELRLARGLSQQELADRAEISASLLSRIESLEKGASPEVLGRLCEVLGCRPEDVLVAPARSPGGQPKVARNELSQLLLSPERIARPRWTSACRLATLRRLHPHFMRRVEPDLVRSDWFLQEVPSESADETLLQVRELHLGAVPTWLSTADLGFDLWPVCDEDGRGAATCLRPALVTQHYAMLFQVAVMAGARRPRMDTLILVRQPQPTFINGEVDGEGHNYADDEQRTRALGMVTLRIPGSDLLKGPSLTERLQAMGYCLPRRVRRHLPVTNGKSCQS